MDGGIGWKGRIAFDVIKAMVTEVIRLMKIRRSDRIITLTLSD